MDFKSTVPTASWHMLEGHSCAFRVLRLIIESNARAHIYIHIYIYIYIYKHYFVVFSSVRSSFGYIYIDTDRLVYIWLPFWCLVRVRFRGTMLGHSMSTWLHYWGRSSSVQPHACFHPGVGCGVICSYRFHAWRRFFSKQMPSSLVFPFLLLTLTTIVFSTNSFVCSTCSKLRSKTETHTRNNLTAHSERAIRL